MPLLRVIRDQHANPTDRMTWSGFDGDGWTHEFCGTVPQPWPEYHQYASLEELDGADLYDAADLMYPWTDEAVSRWPGRVVCTIWENIPYNSWWEGSRRILAGARGFIPRSLTAQRCLEMYGVPPERIALVAAAVDLRQFEPLPRDGLSGERRVLYVGRMVWEKGLPALAHAAQGQRWTVCLVGDGPLRLEPTEVDSIPCLDVGDSRLHFLGPISRADMPGLMRDADVLVLPSVPVPDWMEQFGVAVIEAMAVGTPVVTTDCGAFREIVPVVEMSSSQGWHFQPVVPAGRWDLLRDSVNELLVDPSLWRAYSAACQDRAVHIYGHEIVGTQLREAYGRFLVR